MATKTYTPEVSLEAIKTVIEKIDDWEDPDFPDHARAIPPIMSVDSLVVAVTAGTDTIAAPGDGHHLEVFGFVLSYDEEAATGTTSYISLAFATSSQYLIKIPTYHENITARKSISLSGIRIVGNNNEAFTLTNGTFTGGGRIVFASVYYKDITD